MKLTRKNVKTLCCFMVALLITTALNVVYPLAETQDQNTNLNEDSSVDLTGGVITAISNSRFLSNLPVQTLYTGDTIDILSSSISAVEEQNLTIEKDGTSYTQKITVDWN